MPEYIQTAKKEYKKRATKAKEVFTSEDTLNATLEYHRGAIWNEVAQAFKNIRKHLLLMKQARINYKLTKG